MENRDEPVKDEMINNDKVIELIFTYKEALVEITKQVETITILKEALNFYGNTGLYDGKDRPEFNEAIFDDRGLISREALEQIKDKNEPIENENESIEPLVLFINTKIFSNKMSELNYKEYKEYKAVTEKSESRKIYISLDALLGCGVELSTRQKQLLGIE